ncbi:MAG: SipW-dependent-type signal peptide-containing protein [Mycetocola sp.]
MSDQAPAPSTFRSKKARAILAGGLVLGLGAAYTLAQWSDSEWAQSTFSTGQFNLEGSTDGTTFSEHPTEGDAATLSFSADVSNLQPGQVTSSLFSVRLDAATTVDASVATTTAATGAAASALSYRIVQVATPAACTVTATGTTIVPEADLGTVGTVTPFDLAPGAGSAAGASANLCIIVTADDDLVEDTTASATWTFTATTD